MSRIIPFLILCGVALVSSNCGEDEKGLYGSQCEIMDCSYKVIDCDLYPPSAHAIAIWYRTPLEEGGYTYAAKIAIDTDGVEKVESHKFEGDNFSDIVTLTRGGIEQWPDFNGNFCKINKGGDQAGKKMSGKCAFAFETGYFLTAEFTCTLESTVLP
jgi:hypothetical protein